MIIGEELIIALAVCLALSLLALKFKQPAIALVSSIGVTIVALSLYDDGCGVLVLGLMLALAFFQVLVVMR